MPSPPLPSFGLCWDSAVDETAAVLEQDIKPYLIDHFASQDDPQLAKLV